MVSEYAVNVVATMLAVEEKDIPVELLARITRVDELVKTSNLPGGLGSWQVMASVIEQWERDDKYWRVAKDNNLDGQR